MTYTSLTTARTVRDLHEFERMLAQTLAAGARLGGTLAATRAELGTSPATGQETLLRFARVTEHLLKANGETARAHRSLRRDADALMIVYEPTEKTGSLGADRVVEPAKRAA